MTEPSNDPLPADEPANSDLIALVERVMHLPEAERDQAIAHYCREHPSEDPEALGRAVTEALAGREPADGASRTLAAGRLDRLRSRRAPVGRYVLQGEVARGGMGVILKAYDQDLHRSLAMKVILGQVHQASGETPPVDQTVLTRFLEEAQVTGQLDHPGVVPVHELGLDESGRVYFTMRLVKGRTAWEVFLLAWEGKENWSLAKALEVVLKICDTLAYAHAKGVIHRDIKPQNVMVGRFGEVYVMDWGLAKVRGKSDMRDLRIRDVASDSRLLVRSDRSPDVAGDPDSSLVTMDGTVIGTPSYMAPEQAEGQVEEIDAQSDVYAVGACLYTLLTGCQPYLNPGTQASPHAILKRVLAGPPKPVHEVDRTIPAELAAICDKAMARDKAARYGSMQDLADDLRAYLADRVVKAHRTGALAELRAWTRRNKSLAMVLVLAVIGLVLAVVSLWIARNRTTDALDAWSLSMLDSMGASSLPDPAPGIVRFRRPANRSVFGGHIFDVHYTGPRTMIEFVLRSWRHPIGVPAPEHPTSESVVMRFPFRQGPNGPRQIYILRLQSLSRSDGARNHIVCLQWFDSDRQRTGFRYQYEARELDWLSGGYVPFDERAYSEAADDQQIVIIRGTALGMTPEGSRRSDVVVRFRD